jgi:ABC-type antimicrobial peptide transport system permease subunit
MRQGRWIDSTDGPNAPPVVVINETLEKVFWTPGMAIGQCMRVGADTMPCTTVVGIAEDAVQRSLVDDAHFHYYLPLEQFREDEGFALLVRVRGDPDAQVEAVRRQLQKTLPGQAYVVVRPLHELIDAQRRSWRFGATMFVAFGVLALLVAAVGLYGVIAYNVAQRMHELGVRIALGAQTRDLVRLVVSQGIRFAVVGILLGAGLAFFAGKWIQPLLFQQSARDPLVFGTVASLLLMVALLASFLPARKAAAADPNSALRAD